MTKPKWRHRTSRKGYARERDERHHLAVEQFELEESMSKKAAHNALLSILDDGNRVIVDGGYYYKSPTSIVLEPSKSGHTRGTKLKRGARFYIAHLTDNRFFRTEDTNSQNRIRGERVGDCYHAAWILAVLSQIPEGRMFLEARGEAPWIKREVAKIDGVPKHKGHKMAKREAKEARRSGTGRVEPEDTKETTPMGLLDVKTTEKKLTITQRTHSVSLGRNELIALIRNAGAPKIAKNAEIWIESPAGNLEGRITAKDGFTLTLSWSTSEELEETK